MLCEEVAIAEIRKEMHRLINVESIEWQIIR
jgi:hypothetical protein